MVRLLNSPVVSLTRLLVFLLLLGNIGCQKEMSKDTLGAGGTVGGGGGGTTGGSADFALVPSGNNCSDAAVTGIYEANTTLGADALLTVTVNVTKTGDWTYSTSATNGFSFIGAGNFTTTGSQVITLLGVGKPNRSGTFSFNLKIGKGPDCSVLVVVAATGSGGNGGNNGGTITGDYYYKLTLAGTNYSQDVTASNKYVIEPSVNNTPNAIFSSWITYNTPGTSLPAGVTEFGFSKGTLLGYTATQAQLKNYFAPGDYTYGTVNATGTALTKDGVVLTWTEPGGNDQWSTLDGTFQPGSTFKILSATEGTDAQGYFVKVKVQFSCVFYSLNSLATPTPVSKAVTNGEAVMKFTLQ